MKKRILVIDDQDLFRVGVSAALGARPGFVVHETLVRPQNSVRQIAAINPDLVIIDPFVSAEVDGFSLLAELRERFPALALMVLTCSDDAGAIHRALGFRVSGYMLKNAPARDLPFAVDSIFDGRMFLHPDVSQLLMNAGAMGASASASALTARQEQVLRMIADGRSTRQIAATLGLSAKTVEFHRVMLMNRLGIHHVPGLVRYALRHGYANADAATA